MTANTPPSPRLLTTSGRPVQIREISSDDFEFEASPEGGPYPRFTALLYRLRNEAAEAWAVRINEIGPKNCCCHNLERWFGGQVVGLGKRLPYSAARQIAEAWVARQEMPATT